MGELVQNLKWANKENTRKEQYLPGKLVAPENKPRQTMYV